MMHIALYTFWWNVCHHSGQREMKKWNFRYKFDRAFGWTWYAPFPLYLCFCSLLSLSTVEEDGPGRRVVYKTPFGLYVHVSFSLKWADGKFNFHCCGIHHEPVFNFNLHWRSVLMKDFWNSRNLSSLAVYIYTSIPIDSIFICENPNLLCTKSNDWHVCGSCILHTAQYVGITTQNEWWCVVCVYVSCPLHGVLSIWSIYFLFYLFQIARWLLMILAFYFFKHRPNEKCTTM